MPAATASQQQLAGPQFNWELHPLLFSSGHNHTPAAAGLMFLRGGGEYEKYFRQKRGQVETKILEENNIFQQKRKTQQYSRR